jgi:hypothetical protein
MLGAGSDCRCAVVCLARRDDNLLKMFRGWALEGSLGGGGLGWPHETGDGGKRGGLKERVQFGTGPRQVLAEPPGLVSRLCPQPAWPHLKRERKHNTGTKQSSIFVGKAATWMPNFHMFGLSAMGTDMRFSQYKNLPKNASSNSRKPLQQPSVEWSRSDRTTPERTGAAKHRAWPRPGQGSKQALEWG